MNENPSDYNSTGQLLKILLAQEHVRAGAWFRKPDVQPQKRTRTMMCLPSAYGKNRERQLLCS
ncbi:MAG: hypothetical protein WC294_01860 [Methanoregula sp.]